MVEPRPHWLEPFHVPDRIFVVVGIFVLLSTFFVQLWAWPMLPERVPQHLNVAGEVDGYSQKNIWSVYGITLIMILIGLGLAFSYAHPQYSNIPSNKPWTALRGPLRAQLVMAIRHFLAILFAWIMLLLCCVNLALISEALGEHQPQFTIMLFILTGFLFVTIGGYLTILTRWINRQST